jgi:hypothetical protein
MTTRIVQANKAELSFGSRPHHRRHRCRSPWRLDALNPDFSAISVRQMEFLRTTAVQRDRTRLIGKSYIRRRDSGVLVRRIEAA